jgi:hypothetical protein
MKDSALMISRRLRLSRQSYYSPHMGQSRSSADVYVMSAIHPIAAQRRTFPRFSFVPLPEVGGISIAIAEREAIADDALRRLAAKRDDPPGRQPPEMPGRAEVSVPCGGSDGRLC